MGWFEYLSGQSNTDVKYEGNLFTGYYRATRRSSDNPETVTTPAPWYGWLIGVHNQSTDYNHQETLADTQEIIALHEAAHGRMAAAQGKWRVIDMQADAITGSGLTRVHAKADPAKLKAHLLTCVAGQAGAMRWYVNHGYSKRQARNLSESGTANDRAAFNTAAEGTHYQWDDLLEEAYRFVRRHEMTIESNAKKMAKKGKIGGTWA